MKQSLQRTHPKISKQWYYKKNGELTPSDVTYGSGKKVWWQCEKDNKHIWDTTIQQRTRKNVGCPLCSGRRVSNTNSLKALYPNIAKEWHLKKNGNLNPDNVTSKSNKRVWWKCKKNSEHVWDSKINNRTALMRGCPYCSGNKPTKNNSLAVLYPYIAKMWDIVKNKNISPTDVLPKSEKYAWWLCENNHSYKRQIQSLTNGAKCPYCSKNNGAYIQYMQNSNQQIPKSLSLAILYPEISKKWHPTKNKDKTPKDFTPASNKRVWWKCEKGNDHVWRGTINGRLGLYKRYNSTGCPICHGKYTVLSTSIVTTHPELLKEWHYKKNNNIKPENYSYGSSKKVWWKCKNVKKHVWLSTISKRVNGRNCPYCHLKPQSRECLLIAFELMLFFKDMKPTEKRIKVNSKLYNIDMFIPELNLCIEYDGYYWHKDKTSMDKLKSDILKKKGFNILRIRPRPLKKITPNNIIVTKRYDCKNYTDSTLKYILEHYSYKLDDKKMNEINSYLKNQKCQNTDKANSYILELLRKKGHIKKDIQLSIF